MKTGTKLALSIPSLLLLILIPYNFFADFTADQYIDLFMLIASIEVAFLLCLAYTLYQLWQSPAKTKSTKWTWTLLTILVFQPITTLIYLWAIEPEKRQEIRS